MVRMIGASLAALAVAFGAAIAQNLDEGPAIDAQPPEEPVSELDALSRSTDNPFPDFEESKNRKPISVTIRALNKITARYTDIVAPIGEAAKFGSLEILPRYCDKRPPEEFPETTAFLEVFDRDLARARGGSKVEARALDARKVEAPAPVVAAEAAPPAETESSVPGESIEMFGANAMPPKPVDPDRIFAGWMFASSPGLNALEHPVYDVWVIDCKTVAVDN